MRGYLPTGVAPRMSAVASMLAWEEEQRRLAELPAASTDEHQAGAPAAASAAEPPPQASATAAPQLHAYMPESQVADTDGIAPDPRYASVAPQPFSLPALPMPAPAAAAAAVGALAPDCVDNRTSPPTRGPPAPPPAGEAKDGSQTTWNLVGGLRQGGDAGVTEVRRLGRHGLAPFDNTPFKIPSVPTSSPPRPKPMTPPPSTLLALPSASPSAALTQDPALSCAQGSPAPQLGPALPPLVSASAPPRASPTWHASPSTAVAAPWTAAQVLTAPWTPARVSEDDPELPPPNSSAVVERETAAAAAAAAAVSPLSTSLAAPFPPPPAPRRRRGGAMVGGVTKRRQAKAPTAKSAKPPAKRTKKAAEPSAANCDGPGSAAASASPATAPEAEAAWRLVSPNVAKAVGDSNKALWAALKQSTVQIEHLKASANRLEARVDAQGQGNERTAMAVASMRAEMKDGAGRSREYTDKLKDGAVAGAKSDGDRRVKEMTPFDKRAAAKAVAMELAPENDAKAAQLRRPVRADVKHLVATTTVSRHVLMDSDTATAAINAEVVKTFSITADAAHSYLMNHIYFPSSTKGAAPVLKRPLTVISTTVPHTVAQLRDYVLKPYFKVLGFSYNPMSVTKANKWYKQDRFLTSYKGEKAVVAAAKSLFTKIGGSARIVKIKGAGGRSHVDMVVGHHALIGAFVRNEFEIALGKRRRGRNGNGSGAYMHWVAEFVASVSHLSKNHKKNNVHAGFRMGCHHWSQGGRGGHPWGEQL